MNLDRECSKRKSNRRKRRAAALVVGLTLATTGPAAAMTCEEYGEAAKRQSDEFLNRGCAGGPPLIWNRVKQTHVNWCVTLDRLTASKRDEALRDGMNLREGLLNNCRASTTPRLPGPAPAPRASASPGHTRVPVFQGVACNRWQVTLHQGGSVWQGDWRRAERAACYTAYWTGPGGQFSRVLCPLNERLDFWSDYPDGIHRVVYRNDRSRDFSTPNLFAAGGRWEVFRPDGVTTEEGQWSGRCIDPLSR